MHEDVDIGELLNKFETALQPGRLQLNRNKTKILTNSSSSLINVPEDVECTDKPFKYLGSYIQSK